MELSKKIQKRQESNLEILDALRKLVLAQPELRFTQLLWAVGVFRRSDSIGGIEDTFYEESVDTLEKLKSRCS